MSDEALNEEGNVENRLKTVSEFLNKLKEGIQLMMTAREMGKRMLGTSHGP